MEEVGIEGKKVERVRTSNTGRGSLIDGDPGVVIVA